MSSVLSCSDAEQGLLYSRRNLAFINLDKPVQNILSEHFSKHTMHGKYNRDGEYDHSTPNLSNLVLLVVSFLLQANPAGIIFQC